MAMSGLCLFRRRAFIQVLRLCEHYEPLLVEWAFPHALELGAISL